MTLQVLISTYGLDGLARTATMRLPALDGISYLVSLQLPQDTVFDIPESLRRPDISILPHSDTGLSRNRNYALDHASADVVLIADDDLNYTPGGLQTVLSTFAENPGLAFATFRHTGGDNKQFPETGFSFNEGITPGYYLTSFELALRPSLLPSDIRFAENVGVGTPYFGSGEENLFLLRLLHSGLQGRYFPLTIVEHPGTTTGVRRATPAALRGQGAWFHIRYGAVKGLLRLLRDVPRRHAAPLTALRHMLAGYIHSPRIKF